MAFAVKLNGGPDFVAKNDLTAGTWKVALSPLAANPAAANLSDLTQVANGNGYTTGGVAAQALTESGGIVLAAQVTLTPSGGGFSYCSIYLARVSDGALFPIAWDEGKPVSVTAARILAFSQSAGIATLA